MLINIASLKKRLNDRYFIVTKKNKKKYLIRLRIA